MALIDPALGALPIVIADNADPAALADLAASTRVLINATGPYLLHGEPVVRACAEAGTDYVDLTGEPEFVDLMYLTHHATAQRTGARIVHACGFDSVPHDLGALHAVRTLGEPGAVRLRGIVRAGGGVSGGTLASGLNALARLRPMRSAAKRRAELEPRPSGRSSQPVTLRPQRDDDLDVWLLPLPAIDQQIVARSGAALEEYGNDFSYSHAAGLRRLPTLVGALAGVTVLVAAAQVGPLRRLIGSRLPQGQGPDDATRAASGFTIDFIAVGGGRSVHTRVTGPDPYDLSGIALAESALCLVLDDNPPTSGQVTTAQAMGDALTLRLTKHGVSFDVVDPAPTVS